MNIEDLIHIKPTRTSNGRPSPTLTDKQWQQEFALKKLYITPLENGNKKYLKGRYSQTATKTINDETKYDGATSWQNYCRYINDVLRNIRKGNVDYCYFAYQIAELLRFHFDDLRTKYKEGYWEVWLER